MTDGSRKQFNPRLILISDEQKDFVQADADQRYPERHGPTQRRRNFNPALRDMLDFCRAHYPFFLTWIATRGNSPTETKT